MDASLIEDVAASLVAVSGGKRTSADSITVDAAKVLERDAHKDARAVAVLIGKLGWTSKELTLPLIASLRASSSWEGGRAAAAYARGPEMRIGSRPDSNSPRCSRAIAPRRIRMLSPAG